MLHLPPVSVVVQRAVGRRHRLRRRVPAEPRRLLRAQRRPLSCAAAEQEKDECEIAACGGSCSTATDTALSACTSSADTGECASYVSSVNSSCTTSITGAASCGGGATTFEAEYDAVAATFCE